MHLILLFGRPIWHDVLIERANPLPSSPSSSCCHGSFPPLCARGSSIGLGLLLCYTVWCWANVVQCWPAQVLESNPESVKSLFRRAMARTGLCEFDGAKADLRQLLALEPSNRQSLFIDVDSLMLTNNHQQSWS